MRATDPAARAVLLVDDEGCIRASVSRVLERARYVVTLAASGAEAVGRMCAEPTGGSAAALTPHQQGRRVS